MLCDGSPYGVNGTWGAVGGHAGCKWADGSFKGSIAPCHSVRTNKKEVNCAMNLSWAFNPHGALSSGVVHKNPNPAKHQSLRCELQLLESCKQC